MAAFQDMRAKASRGIRKARKAAELFGEGFRENAASDFDIGLSAASGIWTGLKYKGSVKNGIKAGASTYLALRCLSGYKNMVRKWYEVRITH